MTDIYNALAAVMEDCKGVAKRDVNEHQRFKFRGIDAVVNAVGPILRKHGVIVVPDVESVSHDLVQTSTGKPATACRLLVQYVFYASDGSHITSRVAAEAWDHGDKATPKAMSVAFRTALLQALALPTDEADPDGQTFEHSAQAELPLRQGRPGVHAGSDAIAPKQLSLLQIKLKEAGITDRDAGLAFYAKTIGHEVTTSKELTKVEASQVIDALGKLAAADAPVAPAENGYDDAAWLGGDSG